MSKHNVFQEVLVFLGILVIGYGIYLVGQPINKALEKKHTIAQDMGTPQVYNSKGE